MTIDFLNHLISSSISTFKKSTFIVCDTTVYYDYAYPTSNILCYSSPIIILCKACPGTLLTLVSTIDIMYLTQYLLNAHQLYRTRRLTFSMEQFLPPVCNTLFHLKNSNISSMRNKICKSKLKNKQLYWNDLTTRLYHVDHN